MSQNRSALYRYDDYYRMLSDTVRMQAFRTAIFQCVRHDDVVVDLGAGTGILGFWALEAGARHVHAIEKSEAVELLKQVAAHNGYADRLTVHEASSLDVELTEKADVLVSETLGSLAVDENTLPFTVDARERLLKEDARLIPRRLTVFVAPASCQSAFKKLSFWSDVGGVDFAPALDSFRRKILVEDVEPRALLAEPWTFADVDLSTWQSDNIDDRAVMPIDKAGTVHGFAGWFRAELDNDVVIDTSPGKPKTHWQQAFLPIWPPVRVVKGDFVELSLRLRGQDARSDNTTIDYDYRCTQIANEQQSTTTGRNDPCPCGSGKKFKKCCGKG